MLELPGPGLHIFLMSPLAEDPLALGTERRDAQKICDQPDCEQPGLYRAPQSREDLRSYYWFCLDHVRAYNASWDYYANMDADGIERARWNDTVWNRPTWPMGYLDLGDAPHVAEARLRDALSGFRRQGDQAKRRQGREKIAKDISAPLRQALMLFGLDLPVTEHLIKKRYKVLVKRHHPDTNDGDRRAEEKLKKINGAYQTLIGFVLS